MYVHVYIYVYIYIYSRTPLKSAFWEALAQYAVPFRGNTQQPHI